MIKYRWTHKDITTDEDRLQMIDNFYASDVLAAAIDTETTGLHIKFDRPFLFQCGWITADGRGYTYAVDLELHHKLAIRTIQCWNILACTAPWLVGWNVKFDLHMLDNIGCTYRAPNITEGQCWLRLGADAIPDRKGGVQLGLKAFAKQYIDASARTMDSKVQEQRQEIAKQLNIKLKNRLHWTKKKIDEFFKDKVHDVEDLPEVERELYLEWKCNDVPYWLRDKIRGAVSSDDIPYNRVDRKTLTHYAHLDIVWTLEAWDKLSKIVAARDNMDAIHRENACLMPFYDMESQGLKIDYPYLLQCKSDMKEYILTRREDLCRLAGQTLKSSQHDLLKEILHSKYGIVVEETGKEYLDLFVADLKHEQPDHPAIELIETVQELRTLEKWYATYICRFTRDYREEDGRIYTTINTAGTVSGRVTSDFQQFPKEGIIGLDGRELFHPRKLILADDGTHKGLVFLDFSAMELRLQAFYTILVAGGDHNMCRAYVPFMCHREDDTRFDYTDKEVIATYRNYTWYTDEDNKPWVKTDLHGATTKMAFGIDETHPDFHALRYKGKRINFAKNYGAAFNRIKQMFPEYSDEQLHAIDDAYYKAFPMVKEYHQWVYRTACQRAYMQNMFGVKYYGANGHHLINMLIQGTGAYYVKWKLAEVSDFLHKNNYKTTINLQIHDELVFAWHPDDPPSIFLEIQKIMEDWEDAYIPMVAEGEATVTNWKEKQEWQSLEELTSILTGNA